MNTENNFLRTSFFFLVLALFTFSLCLAQSPKRVIDTYNFEQDVTIYGPSGTSSIGQDQFSVADLNGDGKKDLIFGRNSDGPGGTRPLSGEVDIIFGGTQLPEKIDLLNNPPDVRIYGIDSGDELGVVATGDVNNDAVDDLIIAACLADGKNNAGYENGEIYVLYGRTSWPAEIDLSITPPDVIVYGSDDGDRIGLRITISDLNDDKIGDIVFKARGYGPNNDRNYAGEVYVIFGGSLPSIIDLSTDPGDVVFYGADPYDYFGVAISIGDFNGDTLNDLAISAPRAKGPNNMYPTQGEIYLMFGPLSPAVTDFQTVSPDLMIYAPVAASIGNTMAFGDVNEDGIQDLIFNGSTTLGAAILGVFGRRNFPAVLNLMNVMPDLTITQDDSTSGGGVWIYCSDITAVQDNLKKRSPTL